MNDHDSPLLRLTRRHFLRDCRVGLGAIALGTLLREEGLLAETSDAAVSPLTHPARRSDPLAVLPTHFTPKAKNVIILFMAGGPSHLETFDPKPLLNELSGQPRPAEFGEAKYQFIQRDARLLGSRRKIQKYGEAGIDVSDLFPHTHAVSMT